MKGLGQALSARHSHVALRRVRTARQPASPETGSKMEQGRYCTVPNQKHARPICYCKHDCAPASTRSSGEANAAPVMVMLYKELHCEGFVTA